MKVLILQKRKEPEVDLFAGYDDPVLVRNLTKAGIRADAISLSQERTGTHGDAGGLGLTSIRHFTSIINESWAASIILTCKAADAYQKEHFDVVQANDLAALIAGVQLKWAFKVTLVFSADDEELSAIRRLDAGTRQGAEELLRFSMGYVDHVFVTTGKSLEILEPLVHEPGKINLVRKARNEIEEIYKSLEA